MFPHRDSQGCTEIAALCPKCTKDVSNEVCICALGKEIILPKLGPYNALHLQSILFNINKHSQIWAMKIQNIMWFQLCKASPKSKPGTVALAPAMFVFPLNV